jgi:hypothetical protein
VLKVVIVVACTIYAMSLCGSYARDQLTPQPATFDPLTATQELRDRELGLQRDSLSYYAGRATLQLVQAEGHAVIVLRDRLRAYLP